MIFLSPVQVDLDSSSASCHFTSARDDTSSCQNQKLEKEEDNEQCNYLQVLPDENDNGN